MTQSSIGRGWLLPILGGPLRGMQWTPAAGGKILRLYLGTYEREQSARFCHQVRPGDVVCDVGANAGYYTLMAARLVGPRGRVIACEPEPRMTAVLRRHVRANGLSNVTVVESALGDRNGVARFCSGRGTGTGRLSSAGDYQVRLQTLDRLMEGLGLEPTHVKIDVEGAELDVLRGGAGTLCQCKPSLFLSTHGPRVHKACCQLLQELDYDLSAIGAADLTDAQELFAAA